MRKLTLITALLLGANAFAQNCKYETNDIDKFTGKMTKITKKKKFIETFNSEGHIALQKADTTLTLILSYRTSFSKKVTVGEGAELSFLLEDGKIITLKKTTGKYATNSGQLKTLMSVKTKTLRYYFTDQGGNYKYEDIEIKKSNAEDFIDLIKCVL